MQADLDCFYETDPGLHCECSRDIQFLIDFLQK